MKRKILAVLVLSLGIAGCNTSNNYFEDDDEGVQKPQSFNLFQTAMEGAGVIPKQQKQRLAYKPRAPLAIPSSTNLPAPSDGENSAQAAVNFPVDQDVQEKARQAQLGAAIGPSAERDPEDGSYQGLRGATARSYRLPSEALQAREDKRDITKLMDDDKTFKAQPNKAAKGFTLKKPGREVITADGKAAPRKYLIQPPEEYREPAQTAALPEKGDIENSEWVKKQLYANMRKSKAK
ncbi:hypothetical protein RDV64_10865 [Acuticoccus sp. MNP-M23]|uniref:hypothetical protein n=1 Tax=Acuticoccus sp. MNP-M23 TaxID=3072793 RepID=UPI00281566CE|nr:hypothetical protein [Acuticoccus sp. MNP-M23]WMS44849.1 hypothetical protein RDV64_10865 [Acuticoccus sp. MNP-M23]